MITMMITMVVVVILVSVLVLTKTANSLDLGLEVYDWSRPAITVITKN